MSDIIAFIGVGNMGNPMATNLHKAGYKIKVFDISKEMLVKAKENGLEIVENISELITEKVSTVITMLPEGKHSKEIYLGETRINDPLHGTIQLPGYLRTEYDFFSIECVADEGGGGYDILTGKQDAVGTTYKAIVSSNKLEDMNYHIQVTLLSSLLYENINSYVEDFSGGIYKLLPRTVLEVSADLVSMDEKGNYGLRFPRCKRIREDKFVADTNTLDDLIKLYSD